MEPSLPFLSKSRRPKAVREVWRESPSPCLQTPLGRVCRSRQTPRTAFGLARFGEKRKRRFHSLTKLDLYGFVLRCSNKNWTASCLFLRIRARPWIAPNCSSPVSAFRDIRSSGISSESFVLWRSSCRSPVVLTLSRIISPSSSVFPGNLILISAKAWAVLRQNSSSRSRTAACTKAASCGNRAKMMRWATCEGQRLISNYWRLLTLSLPSSKRPFFREMYKWGSENW